jgi:hypothetical protein
VYKRHTDQGSVLDEEELQTYGLAALENKIAAKGQTAAITSIVL